MPPPSFAVLRQKNKYWKIGARTYSARARDFIDTSDPDYLAWASEGNVAEEFSEGDLRDAKRDAGLPPFAPVTALQARRELRVAGLYDDVYTIVTTSPDPDLLDSWNCAIEWHREAAWILAVQAELALSDDDVDALFVAAYAL